jgi:hypothetical protein
VVPRLRSLGVVLVVCPVIELVERRIELDEMITNHEQESHR